MYKKHLVFIGFLCFVLVLGACTFRMPRLNQVGVERVGPGGSGFQNPVWSPDGWKIAVTTRTVVHSWTSEIFVLDVATGRKKSIMYTNNGSVMAISWSPDGSQILLSSENGGDWPEGIWALDADGISSPEFLMDGYDAAWSPDGESIAIFLLSREGAIWIVQLNIFDIETRTKNLIFEDKKAEVTVGGVDWSPTGGEIIFHYGQPGVGKIDLYTINVATGETTKITAKEENYSPSWSPDGEFIVYLNDLGKGDDSTMIMADKNNICQQKLLTLNDLRWPSWSPDGKHIAFITHGEAYLLDLDKFPTYKSVCP